MNDMNRDDMNHTELKIDMSPEALAHLGDGRIAYVKTIRGCPRAVSAGRDAANAGRPDAIRAARRRRHADHAYRQPRGGGRQCLESGTRDR
jgi:hypothetical protein